MKPEQNASLITQSNITLYNMPIFQKETMLSRSKTEWTAIRKCKMQSAQLPHMTKLKYLGIALQSDGGMNA